MKLIVFDELPSTNSFLKENYQDYPHFTVVQARHQTQGKGRLGKTFIDDSTQLLFSILVKEQLFFQHLQLITLFSAQVVHEFLSNYLKSILIKWPNDLLINNKKICGILTESIHSNQLEALIIGIGINVNTSSFPDDLQSIATSLSIETNKVFDVNRLLNDFLDFFEKKYHEFIKNPSTTLDYQNRFSALTNKTVSFIYENKLMHGIVIEIAENGALHVLCDNQNLYLTSGEISLLKNKTSID